MLRVWFGDRDNVIYNTSVYFRNRYKDSWITDEFAKAAIKDIDRSEVLDANTIQSPVLGQIPPDSHGRYTDEMARRQGEPQKNPKTN